MPTTPPTLTDGPADKPQRGVRATFSDLVDDFVTWISNAPAQFRAIALNVYGNALEAFNSATTATTAATTATSAAAAAAATANATPWASGQTVAQYENKISPLDRQTYRRKTATGTGTTDPMLDTTNYDSLLPLKRMFTSAEQAVTSGGGVTIAHGLGAIPKFVAATVRNTASGRVSFVSTTFDSEGSGSSGAEVSADSTNIYIAYSNYPTVFPRVGSNANCALTVKAFI